MPDVPNGMPIVQGGIFSSLAGSSFPNGTDVKLPPLDLNGKPIPSDGMLISAGGHLVPIPQELDGQPLQSDADE